VRARAAIAAVVLLFGSRAAVAAGLCAEDADVAGAPLLGGTGPADFGAVPEACGATDAMLRLRGALLIASAMPDYYGSIFAGATLRGRYQLGERTTLSLAADVFDYRYVDNGGLAARDASAGPATVGVQQVIPFGARSRGALALYARALLPLDTARQNGIETGLEVGAALRLNAGARFVFDGGVGLAAPLDLVGGQSHLRLQPIALAEAWLRLQPSVALCGGATVRVDASPSFELGTLVPRLGARFSVRRRWWGAALVELPVAGVDRTDLIAGIYAGFVAN
jgi:hypothetical protein